MSSKELDTTAPIGIQVQARQEKEDWARDRWARMAEAVRSELVRKLVALPTIGGTARRRRARALLLS
jgi:hypothetical protein